ncbi:IS3 family transposase, partial [Alkaliphilus hydrothermalis]|nr:transposase InsO family protein [Alkaliphilus hydrothermalis]
QTLEELELQLADYVNWFNKFRIHSTLGYLSPKQFKEHNLIKSV